MRRRAPAGFTLIELLIGVALIAIVLGLAAPSFREFIVMQRLKSINSQLVTDLQFARSEAVSRGERVRVRFQSTANGSPSTLSCYIVYVDQGALPTTPMCDCKAAAGSRCTEAATLEVRTVQLPLSDGVQLLPNSTLYTHFAFDPRSGGLIYPPVDSPAPPPADIGVDVFVDEGRRMRDLIGSNGRVKACVPSGSVVQGWPAC